MPDNKGYSYTSSDTNSQGNHYCSRDYGNGSNSYHYSNKFVSHLPFPLQFQFHFSLLNFNSTPDLPR
ncbi:hypothetical protein BJY04DRAFT_183241 [Aspergillus karnatakaensis]|uniref:uncharacterized protein n=1 Tax=Aspergillus karnatakaensis TaxID=1810916 RepID=UPI003CCE3F40